ncbi:MAG: hypothetical protein J7L96_00865 [Bacteroidales bacterium]|nr:hypothetical protein [Bacteroidales bacterium]
MKNYITKLLAIGLLLVAAVSNLPAQEIDNSVISSILEVQQYNRAIHIMAMLLLGYGIKSLIL